MFESKINRGKANGYAPLDGDGKVSLSNLPDVVGVAGTSGTSGVNGSQGLNGTPGTSGTSGVDGTSGTSPFAGVNTGSFATTGSNVFIGNQSISGSLSVSQIVSINTPQIGDIASADETGISYLTGDLTRWAIFGENAFTIGEWEDVLTGWTVTDNDGFTDIIAGRGSFGAASFQTTTNNWPAPASGKTYVFTSPDYQEGYINPITISVSDNDWEFDVNGGLTFPDETTQTTAFIPTTFATTSSFNELTASLSGVISSSAQITAFGFISSSQTINTSSFVTNSQTSSFVTRTLVPASLAGSEGDIDGMIAFDSGAIYFANETYYGAGPYTTTLYQSTASSPNFPITKGNFPKPKIGWTINVTDGFIVETITNVVEYTDYWLVYTNGGNSTVTAPANVTLTTNGLLDNVWLKQEFISSSIINSLNTYTASLKATTLISGSSQLTSSFDTRYTLSGSVQPLPNGLVSGSSQLTTAFPLKTTGTWTVPVGASVRSFTVDWNHSYQMWVIGNIPNGIISWNANVNVTNANVPVVGNQYGWYYPEGNALVLTSIPPQIVGVNGTISTTAFSTTTSNTFEFGITNNSGATQTINYGYIKLS